MMNIPKLEQNQASGVQAERSSIGQPLSEQKADQVFMFIKNLERFCNEIAQNKLLWTPEVIAFFGIKEAKLLKEYE